MGTAFELERDMWLKEVLEEAGMMTQTFEEVLGAVALRKPASHDSADEADL